MTTMPVHWDSSLKNVAVFRALNLGDMLCAIPALRALRNRLPHAHITLVGLENAMPIMQHFSGYLDEFIEFPGDPAFPEQAVRVESLPDFYRDMRARHFDLILQMHGSGQQSNALVRTMEPAQWLGFVPQRSQVVEGRFLLWPDHLHEVHRYLALLRHAGVDAHDDTLELPLSASDDVEASVLVERLGLTLERLVFIHPGARLASRRWPLERYSAVARALAEAGWQVAITGSKSEKPMSRALMLRTGLPLVDLCGMTTLGVLASLLQRGRLLVCNDTGISHVAASVKLPSVVIACGSDVARWRPLDTRRHTVVHARVACRPCAYDVCPIGHPCAMNIEVDEVLAQVYRRLGRRSPR